LGEVWGTFVRPSCLSFPRRAEQALCPKDSRRLEAPRQGRRVYKDALLLASPGPNLIPNASLTTCIGAVPGTLSTLTRGAQKPLHSSTEARPSPALATLTQWLLPSVNHLEVVTPEGWQRGRSCVFK
jgi:hypothetical protein